MNTFYLPNRAREIVNHAVTAWILAFSFCSSSTYSRENNFDFIQSTYLVEIKQGSTLSDLVGGFRNNGYESANGSKVRFDKWYSSNWVDTRIGFLTQLSPSFGLLWGVGTGERGEKYKIEPSFKVGFLYQHSFSANSNLSISATTTIGGRLKESACTADYGDIGGIQTVNCRLAASTLPPSQTLNYLENQDPQNKNQFFIRYTFSF